MKKRVRVTGSEKGSFLWGCARFSWWALRLLGVLWLFSPLLAWAYLQHYHPEVLSAAKNVGHVCAQAVALKAVHDSPKMPEYLKDLNAKPPVQRAKFLKKDYKTFFGFFNFKDHKMPDLKKIHTARKALQHGASTEHIQAAEEQLDTIVESAQNTLAKQPSRPNIVYVVQGQKYVYLEGKLHPFRADSIYTIKGQPFLHNVQGEYKMPQDMTLAKAEAFLSQLIPQAKPTKLQFAPPKAQPQQPQQAEHHAEPSPSTAPKPQPQAQRHSAATAPKQKPNLRQRVDQHLHQAEQLKKQVDVRNQNLNTGTKNSAASN